MIRRCRWQIWLWDDIQYTVLYTPNNLVKYFLREHSYFCWPVSYKIFLQFSSWRCTRSLEARTLQIPGFELGPKTLDLRGFRPKALKIRGFYADFSGFFSKFVWMFWVLTNLMIIFKYCHLFNNYNRRLQLMFSTDWMGKKEGQPYCQ